MTLAFQRTLGRVDVVRSTPARRRFGVPGRGPWDREAHAWVTHLLPACEEVYELVGSVTFVPPVDGTLAVMGREDGVIVDGEPQIGNGRFPVAAGALVTIRSGQGVGTFGFDPTIAPAAQVRSLDPMPTLLRVLPGPQASDGLEAFMDEVWRVSPLCDRRGIRLQGPPVGKAQERPSEPSCVGTIQLTGDGLPIILGPDGPTIGGYAKIGVVIDADLDFLARVNPGQIVRFAPVSMERALSLRRERQTRLSQTWTELQIALTQR